MPDTETRVTSPTGGEKGSKLPAFGGIDPRAALELARVYGFGERKYARYNYLKGYKWSLTVDALFRHLFAFLDREDNDPESGLNHMAHVAWHALTLLAFSLRGIGEDDRFKANPYAERVDGYFINPPSWEALPELCACHTPGIPVGAEHVRQRGSPKFEASYKALWEKELNVKPWR